MSVKTDVGRLHIKHLVDPSVDYWGVIDWNKKIFNVVSNNR